MTPHRGSVRTPRHGPPLVPVAPPRPRPQGPGWGALVALAVLGVLGLVALGVVGFTVGPGAFVGATVLALLPLAAVGAAVVWVDRWEPEPPRALAVAFAWGASVSVLVALVVNTAALGVMLAAGADELSAGAATATLVAPVVEEAVKGVGVLVLFLVWRRFFDGPVDGLVYAACVAAGFAFVENVLYFGEAIAAAGSDVGASVAVVFVLRAVVSPFAHVLFTACVGLALGWAAQRSRTAWTWAFPLGLVGAVALHALWNGTASLGDGSAFVVVYVVFQVPFFLATLGLVVWLRSREARVIRARLGEYAQVGWFSPQEVDMLGSLRARRRARTWAASHGGRDAARTMHGFQAAATQLAYLRQRMLRDRSDLWRSRHDEAALLARLERVRTELAARLARR